MVKRIDSLQRIHAPCGEVRAAGLFQRSQQAGLGIGEPGIHCIGKGVVDQFIVDFRRQALAVRCNQLALFAQQPAFQRVTFLEYLEHGLPEGRVKQLSGEGDGVDGQHQCGVPGDGVLVCPLETHSFCIDGPVGILRQGQFRQRWFELLGAQLGEGECHLGGGFEVAFIQLVGARAARHGRVRRAVIPVAFPGLADKALQVQRVQALKHFARRQIEQGMLAAQAHHNEVLVNRVRHFGALLHQGKRFVHVDEGFIRAAQADRVAVEVQFFEDQLRHKTLGGGDVAHEIEHRLTAVCPSLQG